VFVSRVICDPAGVRWLVYEVAPIASSPTLEALRQRLERRRSWLAFESEQGELRAMVPAPSEWPRWSDASLAQCLAQAAPADRAQFRRANDPPSSEVRLDDA